MLARWRHHQGSRAEAHSCTHASSDTRNVARHVYRVLLRQIHLLRFASEVSPSLRKFTWMRRLLKLAPPTTASRTLRLATTGDD